MKSQPTTRSPYNIDKLYQQNFIENIWKCHVQFSMYAAFIMRLVLATLHTSLKGTLIFLASKETLKLFVLRFGPLVRCDIPAPRSHSSAAPWVSISFICLHIIPVESCGVGVLVLSFMNRASERHSACDYRLRLRTTLVQWTIRRCRCRIWIFSIRLPALRYITISIRLYQFRITSTSLRYDAIFKTFPIRFARILLIRRLTRTLNMSIKIRFYRVP